MGIRMTSRGRGLHQWFAALIACALLPLAAVAQAPPAGVFAEVQTLVVPRPSAALEPATVRSRVVQVNTQKITAARRGREILKLNLFDDAVVDIQIKRVRPTRSGYFISGTPKGMEWGEVRLVVNGPVMVGTVGTSEGKFTIRSEGRGRHVIREIDPSKEPFECEVLTPAQSDIPRSPPERAISSIDLMLPQAASPAIQASDMPTEDGSEVRVLIVYTPALQAEQGGATGMKALIDLFVQSANQAFEDSGISPRLVLAHSAMVDYVAEDPGTDLFRLQNSYDGYMDEVHTLRNKHAADLVHLLTNPPTRISGIAYLLQHEALDFEFYGFALSAVDDERVFTHEIGHNFGAAHDRFVMPPEPIYSFAYGYVNEQALKPDASLDALWYTVMAYPNRCRNAGLDCQQLLRFSNPDQSYMGDPLGVPADSEETGFDGPADTRRTLNNTARWVGSFRSEACTDFDVTPETPVAPVGGGELGLRVDSAPGCVWEGSSQADFLTVSSDAKLSGADVLRLQVEANDTGTERSGTVTVAGKTITVVQLAADKGICGRTSLVVLEIMDEIARFNGPGRCDDVTAADLARVENLGFYRSGTSSFESGDFEGLSGLIHLELGFNGLTELPEGLFAGLASLEHLGLTHNRLTDVPTRLLAGLSSLQFLQLDNNELDSLPASLFVGLDAIEVLYMHGNRLTDLSSVTFAGMSSLKELRLDRNELTRLPEKLFADSDGLEHLDLLDNRLTEMPAGVFAGLSDLEYLGLSDNQLSGLPVGIFADLSALEYLAISANRLSDLPAGLFAGLSSLQRLALAQNQITGLPVGLFAGLSRLNNLDLHWNRLTRLPEGIFSGLQALENLRLSYNELTHLPEGIFSGQVALRTLNLDNNLIQPLPLLLSLEKVGESQFKALAPAGAPFNLDLPVSIGSAGSIEGGAVTLTIPAGAVESAPLTVARVQGSLEGVSVNIGTLPGLPGGHIGYALGKDESLPRLILPSVIPTDAELVDLLVSNGRLEPAFAASIMRYTTVVAHIATTITVRPETSNTSATVAFLDASDRALADSDASIDGHQVNLSVGENTLKVKIASEDGTATQIYTLVVTRDGAGDVCGRTAQVRDAIMAAVSGVDACTEVTKEHLRAITRINSLSAQNISTLKSGDFAGMTSLRFLSMTNNQLNSLPDGLFSGLTALTELGLGSNELISLPDGVFSGLTALQDPTPYYNRLASLPADVFSGMPALQNLRLGSNRLRYLPAGVFSGLSALELLNLGDNRISSLPADIFAGLTALENLNLYRNRLLSLPPGIFSGLISLKELRLQQNRVDPLPLPLTLEKVGDSQFKMVAPTGAPFTLELPVSISGGGVTEGAVSIVTIPIGAVDSAPIGVTRVPGKDDAVNVDIGELPAVPEKHRGYSFEKDETLPREILPGPKAAPPAQVTGIELAPGVDQLAVSWAAVSDADGYRVQWKSGEEIYDEEMRQVVVTDRETTSYTIRGLTPGTDYTVRVIATKDNADDGAPSSEVTGTPRAMPPGQVMGVEVAVGVEQLEVNWTAVSDASGYKVQWKSGEEDYGEARQAVIDVGDTVAHAITGLTAGTQYTIRVIAAKAHADDGAPSAEVTGAPRAMSPDQVMGVVVSVGVEQLEVTWTAVSDADGYKVQWKSGEEEYDAEREVALTGGDTAGHTITGLAAGAEYTIRVIAVMANADDGPSSTEVTGRPKAMPPVQVADIELLAVVEQLEVFWTAASDANGYKVQWRANEEDYDDTRQAVLTGGDTVSYVITDLTAGTEYAVHVIATKEHADDGLPSGEVTGTPKATPPAKVSGVEIAAGVEQLEVLWTVVSDADGYKVQWKSGTQAYDEDRQAVLTGGDTASHTIADSDRGHGVCGSCDCDHGVCGRRAAIGRSDRRTEGNASRSSDGGRGYAG